ncbi:hypothetical protein ACFX2I_032655 [Malus domestica]
MDFLIELLILSLFAAVVGWSQAVSPGLQSLRQGSSLTVEEESDFLVSPNGISPLDFKLVRFRFWVKFYPLPLLVIV